MGVVSPIGNNLDNFWNNLKNGINGINDISLFDTTNFDEVISFCKEIKKHLIITRGDKGAVSINNSKIEEIDSRKDLKIVDLTGAGDLFAAGFLFGFSKKLSLDDCGKLATKSASNIIQQYGARPVESLSKLLIT